MRAGSNRPPVVVFYISGHGFGHASRVIEVINAFGALCPEAHCLIRTSAAPWLFDVTLRVPAELRPVETDTGVIQRDSLHLDIEATTRAAREFYEDFSARAADEAAWLRDHGATLVVGDIPPLAFEAAWIADLPAVALGNFTWDWIYEAYAELDRDAPDVLPTIRRAYRRVTYTLRLPMWGGFGNWPCQVVDIPFVARHSLRDPGEVRRQLGVDPSQHMVLASFGGLGIAELDLARLGRLDGYTVVTTGHALGHVGNVPAGVMLLDDRDVYQSGLRYEDLVAAAEVVVTKPGYGIIAECVANNTALLYTSRGHFVEYDVFVAAMPRVLRCRFMNHDDLYAGRWLAHLDALRVQADPPERPRTDGATVAAAALLAMTAEAWRHATLAAKGPIR
jgi:hypothetical protein